MGEYPQPTSAQVNEMLAQFMKGRFSTDQQFEKTLAADDHRTWLKRYVHSQSGYSYRRALPGPAVLVTDDDMKAVATASRRLKTASIRTSHTPLRAINEEIRQLLPAIA